MLRARQQVMLQEVYSATSCQSTDGGYDVLVILAKWDTQKSFRNSPVDVVKGKLTQLARKHQVQVGHIELDANECLQRVRTAGRRPFANHIEDKLVLASIRGMTTAVVGRMRFLTADTFFNRWPVPVLPVSVLSRATEVEADQIFDMGIPAPKTEQDTDNGDDSIDVDPACLDIAEGQVIPFPHEHHQALTQELTHVFHCDVLIDMAPGSGVKLLAVLLSNLRAPPCRT